MKILITTLLLVMSAFDVFSADIIPEPVTLKSNDGVFRVGPATRIVTDAALQPTAQYLSDLTGYPITANGDVILTTQGANPSLGSEGYEFEVTTDRIVIRAPHPAGVFYGVQTLRQLLPVEKGVTCEIPCVHIEDQPRFPWRGLMLDVSRHFFNKTEVKQLLDAMALHKINMFHWHLTDDPGWRIEIKKYPKLTEVSAWRPDIGFGLDPKASTAYGPDGRYGGFYTQDDIREVVAYAAARHITIVPEIEMPCHARSAVEAYPQFSCAGTGVYTRVYCVGQDETYGFLKDVLEEVAELFPGKYIHIGGDEVPKGSWKECKECQDRIKAEGLKNERELQSYFIRRVEKLVNSKGRRLIGWSEIREGGLAQNTVVMDWIGGAVEAAQTGHDVVMSPTSHCYFDFYQSYDRSTEPKGYKYAGTIPVQKVYSFDPIPAKLAPEFRKHILGAQGNVWTEVIPSLKHVEYMTFPRLTALAEVTWSPAEKRDWDDFNRRLAVMFKRYDALGINYRHDTSTPIGNWKPSEIKTTGSTLEWDATKAVTVSGTYKIDMNWTKGTNNLSIAWVALFENGKEIARDAHPGISGADPKKSFYTLTLPEYRSGARYTIQAHITGKDGVDSRGFVSVTLKEKK